MNGGTVDDRVWGEARSRAGIVARTLPDAPADQRLSLAEAARYSELIAARYFDGGPASRPSAGCPPSCRNTAAAPKGIVRLIRGSMSWLSNRSRPSTSARNAQAFGSSWMESARNAAGRVCRRHKVVCANRR